MILPQLGMMIFAILFAWQQSSAIKLFIDYVPKGDGRNMKNYHKAGGALALVVAVFISLFAHSTFVTTLLACLILYWLVFDIALNLMLDKPWDYIGETAMTDKMLHKMFPHGDAGEVKLASLLFLTIVVNIIESFL
jgi:hypothetical protein